MFQEKLLQNLNSPQSQNQRKPRKRRSLQLSSSSKIIFHWYHSINVILVVNSSSTWHCYGDTRWHTVEWDLMHATCVRRLLTNSIISKPISPHTPLRSNITVATVAKLLPDRTVWSVTWELTPLNTHTSVQCVPKDSRRPICWQGTWNLTRGNHCRARVKVYWSALCARKDSQTAWVCTFIQWPTQRSSRSPVHHARWSLQTSVIWTHISYSTVLLVTTKQTSWHWESLKMKTRKATNAAWSKRDIENNYHGAEYLISWILITLCSNVGYMNINRTSFGTSIIWIISLWIISTYLLYW